MRTSVRSVHRLDCRTMHRATATTSDSHRWNHCGNNNVSFSFSSAMGTHHHHHHHCHHHHHSSLSHWSTLQHPTLRNVHRRRSSSSSSSSTAESKQEEELSDDHHYHHHHQRDDQEQAEEDVTAARSVEIDVSPLARDMRRQVRMYTQSQTDRICMVGILATTTTEETNSGVVILS
jgi:hypothetical protein